MAAMLLACSLAAGMLAGCSGQNGTASGPATSSGGSYEITSVRPIPDGLKFTGNDSLESNVWTKLYESELGIKLKYDWMTPVAQYEQKLNIAITSNSLPDIFQVNAVQLKQLVDEGLLADLTSVYDEKAAPYTKDVLNQDGGHAVLSATFDGKLLAIPKMDSGLGNTDVLWVRTDWLKKLGLPEPETMDDVISIANSFTENDPDGNGKKDTYGLGLNKELWGMFASMEGFFNGYGAYPNIWVKDASGKLVNGNVQPAMKEALKSLQDLFKAGCIDPEFGVKDGLKVSEDVGKGKIGMLYGLFWNMGWLSDAKTANPGMDWKAYPIAGVEKGGALAQVPFPITTYYVVNKDCKHPKAIVDMLNLQLEKCFGETAQPEVYNVDAAGDPIFEYPLIYSEPPMKNMDAQVKISAALQSKDVSKLNAEEKGYYNNIVAFQGGDLSGWSTAMMYGSDSSLAVINGYAKDKKTYDNCYYGPPTATMTQDESTLSQLQMQDFTEIIMGADISEFDKYVSDWKSVGGNTITGEVNEWLQKQ